MMTCACCAFRKVKKGLWSPDEDQKLTDFVSEHGIKRWSQVPLQAGLERCGKSCRLRWLNYLRPGIKRGQFSPEEQQLIVELQALYGNRWSWIAQWVPGRTDNEIKNFWNVHMGPRKCKRTITFDHVSSYRLAVPFKLELCEPKLLEPQIQAEAPVPVLQDSAYAIHSSPSFMDDFGLDDMILDATVQNCMNWSHMFMQPDHLLPCIEESRAHSAYWTANHFLDLGSPHLDLP